jgi:uncharacterized membrane protein (DUF106 family)
MQDIFADFQLWFNTTFAIFQDPPLAALFIMMFSLGITTVSNLAQRRFTDTRRLKRYQAEIKQHQEMQKEAEKTQNEKMMRKVRRRKAYIERIQRESMTARCKPSLMFFIPFIIVFSVLRGFYFDAVAGVDRVGRTRSGTDNPAAHGCVPHIEERANSSDSDASSFQNSPIVVYSLGSFILNSVRST